MPLPSAPAPASVPSAPPAPRRAPRILVVDDEAPITAIVALKLRNAGYDVTTASDGAAAQSFLEAGGFDLLIADVHMPLVDGLRLARNLRQHPTLHATPVILITARGFRFTAEELAPTGIVAVVHKPFSPRELLKQVEEAVGRAPAPAERSAA